MSYHIRELRPDNDSEITLIASRMRETLIEVLGHVKGDSMYTKEWLEDRVRFHLAPERIAEVFLAECDADIVGHTIVRVESDEDGEYGLFSTTYVLKAYRRQQVANALLLRSEQWMRTQGLKRAATNTSDSNVKLINLYEHHGYKVLLRAHQMVHLSKILSE